MPVVPTSTPMTTGSRMRTVNRLDGLDSVAGVPPSARRPAIVAVDDEPAVLAAVDRDLRKRYGERVPLVRAPSGAEALEIARASSAGAASRSRC